uniref:Fibronectin type-III domain-containing protein n=1 Tax=Seriola dumerili TaxID=41447 RepID=A0A3B4UY97_SERDU
MDFKSGGTMEVAALGRPFCLGMLYDCRSDSLVSGMTLWDLNDLKQNIRERPQNYNDFEIDSSVSIESKSLALNVEGSLKASFLSGLVEVEGSAKYLNDHKTSRNQARVTLTYKATTKVQELSMNHLGRGNVKHQYVFDKGIATHVVTGILYGAQAFFVFNHEVSEKEDYQDIKGKLKLMIKKIPLFAKEGKSSLKMEDKDRANVDKFSCRFYGDFSLNKNPVCFQDAVEVYQSLPKLLGANGENAVPMKVWLLPLTVLDSSAAQLVRQISIRLVQEAQSVLEDFSELDMRCNDAMRTTTAQQFPQISKKLKSFKEMFSEFKLEFQQNLAKKLPSIRGGGEEEAVLAEILKNRHSSPFNSKSLNEWMDCKDREVYTLMSFTNMMKSTKIIQSQSDLYKETLSAEHAVCFVFTSLGRDEPYLSALSNYLRGTTEHRHPHTHDVEREQWFASKEVADEIRHKAKLFIDFAEANKENKNIKFLTVGLTNETQKGSSIYLYKDGISVSENFEPPSKPETVTGSDINHNSVTLKISPPRFGAENITSYCVEYCVRGEEGWQQHTASKAEEVTVSDLSPDTEYVFRCRAVTSVGVGPVNEVNASIKTLPCSPPEKPQVEPNSSEISVSWQKPAELGQDVQILSYIVEYAQTDKEVKEEDLQWKQTMSRAEKAIISGLQSETEYAVRIRCDCGVAGRSKESIAVNVCTTKFKPLKEYYKRTSERMNSESPSVYKLPLTEKEINIDGCRRFEFGKESWRRNRTIILLGATGSGKSTLINAMINYIVGGEWKDHFRFTLTDEDQSKSGAEIQTSEATVYKIHHQESFKINYSLTIVDTPGFGDTRGIERDRMIVEQLRNLFSSEFGVSEIDAVCFVAPASLARLTPTQKYVFDSVLSIFGKDVAENIRVLVTFADGKRPPVLEAIKASGVPCPKTKDGLPVHFKFNNSSLFAKNRSSAAESMSEEDDEDGSFDQMFWNMGTKSMQRFFVTLNEVHTKSLAMTNEVLRVRQQLENSVEGLQKQLTLGLDKLKEIKDTEEQLKELEEEITKNKNFEFKVTVTKAVQIDLSGTGKYITTCLKCHFTCHDNCPYENKDIKHCPAMGADGNCTKCPGKCHWRVHLNQKYKWEYREVKGEETVKELQEKYLKATEEKAPVQALIDKLKAEYNAVQAEVVAFMKRSAQCLNRLKEIALKPNPLSTPEYIDMLIEGEKSEAKPGWKQRVQALIAMRQKAEIMAKVERGETLLLSPEGSLVFLPELR